MTTQGSQVGEIPKEHLIALLLCVAAIATGVALLLAASLFYVSHPWGVLQERVSRL